ncbi:MAG TPA: carotenoid oxygenase family protein [Myxococcales bacterium]|nr:carotenoid oxygenase family protein [Myxococcales bacterium]
MTSPPHWRRAFQPLPREHGFQPLEVEGTFPPDLRGTLYRVGPGSFAAGAEAFGHWFDGDGAVTAVRLGDGAVEGACRFVDARERAVEQRLGRRAFRGFGTGAPHPAAARVKRPVNVGALWWGGQLYALGEGASPHAVDAATLETRGPSDLGGALRSAFAAHPHRVPARRAAYNFGLRHGRRFEVDLLELPDGGPARLLCTVPLRSPRYLHDFAVTERRAVFVLPPLEADLDALLGGTGPVAAAFRWRADAATEILTVELDPPHRATWSEADPFFVWHLASAAEQGGGEGLWVDLVSYPDFGINDWYGALPYREPGDAPPGTLARVRVAASAGPGARAPVEPLSDVSCEMPAAAGGAVAAVARTASAPGGAPHDAVAVVDRESGRARWLSPGPDRYPSGEPCVAGQHLLTLVYDARAHRSGLMAFDLRDPGSAAGPVAAAWFDHHLPPAFHGAWVCATGR